MALLYSSCVKKENYPNVPVITFNSYQPFLSGLTVDSAYLRVNFTDGNGNIGYPSQQTGVNPDFYIVAMVYVNSTKTYDSLYTFPYLVPDITPTGSDKELNGIIQINLEGAIQNNILDLASEFPAGYANFYDIEFKIWMFDRAGNKSNVLITPPINPLQPLQ